MGKIKILIADDHAVVREGTRQILEQEPDLDVVAEAADGEEAVRLAGSSSPDVAIVDIAMPKIDGIEATKQIKALYPSITVLILTAYDDDQFIFSLLEAGAAGYLLKSVHGRELVEAVRQVNAGESVLHPAVVRKVINRFVPSAGKPEGQEAPQVLSELPVPGLLRQIGLVPERVAADAKVLCGQLSAEYGVYVELLQGASACGAYRSLLHRFPSPVRAARRLRLVLPKPVLDDRAFVGRLGQAGV